jgi:outer membrane protein TolC
MARRDRLAQAEDEALLTLKQTDAFYQRGAMNLLSVLDAEQSRIAPADELAMSETAVRVSMVSLYRAFGGGWPEKSSVANIQRPQAAPVCGQSYHAKVINSTKYLCSPR